MSPATQHFAILLTAVVAVIGLVAGALRVLVSISWKTGQLVERFDQHAQDEKGMHEDIEKRLRDIERKPGRRA